MRSALYAFVYLVSRDDAMVNITNCTMKNVTTQHENAYFILIEPHILHHIVLNVQSIIFDQLSDSTQSAMTQFIFADTDSKFINSQNQISITSSSFYGGINVLNTNRGIFGVNIHDINIKMSHFYRRSEQISYSNALRIGRDTHMNLSNVHFETQLVCNKLVLLSYLEPYAVRIVFDCI